MNYTAKQIETGKANYNNILIIRTVVSYNPEQIGRNVLHVLSACN